MDDQRTDREGGKLSPTGTTIVEGPCGEDFDLRRWRAVFPLLHAHGFDARSFTSSTLVAFTGTRESADELRVKVAEFDPGFTVRWEAEWLGVSEGS